MNINWIKVAGVVCTVGAGLFQLGSDFLSKKNAVAALADSKEVKDLIAKEVAKAVCKQ